MGLNSTPAAERVHIGIFGRRNAGKSSLINAITGQSLAIVSKVAGTTTDPVSKAMELLPLGPVVLIDTPGIDDEGELGGLRVRKSYQVLNKTDIAVLVIEAAKGVSPEDQRLLARIREKQIPCILVFSKADCMDRVGISKLLNQYPQGIAVSAETGEQIWELKERLAEQRASEDQEIPIIKDLVSHQDFVMLVVPIDKAAPKGRLILPQQQTIRELLEAGAVTVVVQEERLKSALEEIGKTPGLVITDSQVFQKVSETVPREILLTSFSILFARHKGNLKILTEGAAALKSLSEGDLVLISEGCTHHRQCNDIGTVKIPAWIRSYTGKRLEFEFTSGTEFPENLEKYSLIVHCGGCMLNEREMKYRIRCASDTGVPITNYGILIAMIQGILDRSLELFPEVKRVL